MSRAECGKCKSSATYCVVVSGDDDSGLRTAGGMMRHVCAICGFEELLPENKPSLALSTAEKQQPADKPNGHG